MFSVSFKIRPFFISKIIHLHQVNGALTDSLAKDAIARFHFFVTLVEWSQLPEDDRGSGMFVLDTLDEAYNFLSYFDTAVFFYVVDPTTNQYAPDFHVPVLVELSMDVA